MKYFSLDPLKRYFAKGAFVLLTVSTGCNSNLSAPDSYIQYVINPSHGLKIEKNLGDISFIIQYKPTDYVTLQEISRPEISKSEFIKTKKQFGNLEYFTFTIKSNKGNTDPLKLGVRTDNDYFQRLNYLSLALQKDFKLIEANDTLQCVLEHFERTYGIVPHADVVLAFEAPKSESTTKHSDKILIFNDQIYDTGIHEFIIKSESIRQVPILKTI